MADKFFEWDNDEDEEAPEQEQEAAPQIPTAPPTATEEEPFVGPPAPEESPIGGPEDEEVGEGYNNYLNRQEYEEAEGRSNRPQDQEHKRVGAIASRELAWGLAQKAVEKLNVDDPEIAAVRDAIVKRTHDPIGIAQDLRTIASRINTPGSEPLVNELHNAADKLLLASKQEAQAGGDIQRGALPLTSSEAEAKQAEVQKKLAAAQGRVQYAGVLGGPLLQKEIADLNRQNAALQATKNAVAPQQPPQDKPPTQQGDIKGHLDAMPGGYGNFLKSVEDVTNDLKKAGINVPPGELLKYVPLPTAMSMLLKTVDPQDMSGWKKFLSQMNDREQQGAQSAPSGSSQQQNPAQDADMLAIQQKQAKYQMLMNRLGNLHSSQNWLSAIGMFITAILVGPKAALMIWGRAGEEHSLRTQLQYMHEDITQSIQMRQQQQMMDYRNRSAAARASNQRDIEGQRETAALTRIYLHHQLAMDRAKQNGLKDPDARQLQEEFNNEMRLSGTALREATDPTNFDQNKKELALRISHQHSDRASKITDLLRMPEAKKEEFRKRHESPTAPVQP
jgi:hypothetical protein